MIDKFKSAGIDITEEQQAQFEKLMSFMLEYNKNVNLTRITERGEVIEKHYIDSILPLVHVNVPRGTKICDIGSGAGFPALPMKIYRPDLLFTLVDSLNKRITYLDLACKEIGVSCKLVHGRSEELGRKPEFREQYDFVTARAVAALNVLSEYCLPFVKVGGYFMAMKGAENEVDLGAKAIEKLGGSIEKVDEYTLPGGDKRCIVLVKKVRATPPQYPRASGVMAKRPL